MSANLENPVVATDWKRSVFILTPKKGHAKECSNYWAVVLISHASKAMLKILQARLQQSLKSIHFQMNNLGLEKAEEPEINLTTFDICWIIEKASELQ